MSRSTRWALFAVGIIAFLSVCAGMSLHIEVSFYLVAGWLLFLRKTLPQVQVNWPDLTIAIGALLAFLVGLHRFAAWLSSSNNATQERRNPWPFRRSLAIGLLVIIAFAAGTALVGISHQIAWMATSKEPLVSSSVRESSYRNTSTNNSRQIGFAAHNYHDRTKALPAGHTRNQPGIALHGWQLPLLPYLDETKLYNVIDNNQPWNADSNAKFFRHEVYTFLNPYLQRRTEPDSKEFAPSHYASNRLVIGPHAASKLSDIKDGTSKTFLGGEVMQNPKPWGSTNNWRDPRLGINKSPNGFGGPWSSQGAVMVMADGSTRFMSKDIDPTLLEALATPDGGEDLKQLSSD